MFNVVYRGKQDEKTGTKSQQLIFISKSAYLQVRVTSYSIPHLLVPLRTHPKQLDAWLLTIL